MDRSAPFSPVDGERVLAELGWVRALARSLVRDPDVAEDAVQEAWLLAVQRPPRTRTQLGLRAWLGQVTRTLVRSRLRGERARERREEGSARPEASEPSAFEIVARTQLQQAVVAAVMALEEPYRSAVLLRHVDGLSAREIAVRQGTSVENARQRVARGLALLRRALDREHGGDGRSWVLALVPFLRPSGPEAAAALLGGTAVVKTSFPLLATLAATVLGFVLLRHTFEREAEPLVAAGGAARGLSPSTPPAPEAPAEVRTAPAESGAREPVSLASTSASPSARVRVHARLLDARGRPLPGAELEQPLHEARAVADANGDVELEFALDPAKKTRIVADGATFEADVLDFVARAGSCRDALRTEARPAAGAVLELGELRLYPIGAVGGIVRDASGLSVAGADVRLTLPSALDERRARLFGPEYTLQERRMQADAEGRFLYDDVPEGLWCVWAGAPGMQWVRSEPLRIEPAAAIEEYELVLALLDDANTIRGVVRAAEGGVLAGVELVATADGAAQPASWATSDAAGRFELVGEAGVPYRVRASQPQPRRSTWNGGGNVSVADLPDERHEPVTLEGVRPGPDELVLVMPVARFLDVAVVERGGGAVREGVSVHEQHDAPGGDGYYSLEKQGERAGLARVLVPDAPFTLAVRTEGYEPASVGPLDPLALPPAVRIELVPLPRVRGTVHAGGEPVAGVRVQLMQIPPPVEVEELYDFPARLSGWDLRGTETDAAGRFELPIPFRTECALLAEKDGYAAAERSPLVFAPGHDERVDLELGLGGAVEGRVLVPEGESPAGIVVRFCRGDMRSHEAVTDEDGRYRVERLTPGPFMVLAERKRAGLSFGFAASVVEKPPVREHFEFPWALEVREGETTHHDVDLAAQERATLEGSLLIDGAPPAAAVARLAKAGAPWLAGRFDAEQAALESDGSFAFEERRREGLYLVLEPGAGALSGTKIVQVLELGRGPNRVELELASAALRGRLPAEERGPFALVTEPAPGVFTVTPIAAGPDHAEGFELASVPAADSARLVGWRAGEEREDPRTWSELARFALPAGRWTELE
jgi:RNA polymerase sigma factor (sigma-70 family)